MVLQPFCPQFVDTSVVHLTKCEHWHSTKNLGPPPYIGARPPDWKKHKTFYVVVILCICLASLASLWDAANPYYIYNAPWFVYGRPMNRDVNQLLWAFSCYSAVQLSSNINIAKMSWMTNSKMTFNMYKNNTMKCVLLVKIDYKYIMFVHNCN